MCELHAPVDTCQHEMLNGIWNSLCLRYVCRCLQIQTQTLPLQSRLPARSSPAVSVPWWHWNEYDLQQTHIGKELIDTAAHRNEFLQNASPLNSELDYFSIVMDVDTARLLQET